MLQIIIPAIIGAVIAAIIVGYFAHSAGRSYERKQYDSKVGSAEEKAREIIDLSLIHIFSLIKRHKAEAFGFNLPCSPVFQLLFS